MGEFMRWLSALPVGPMTSHPISPMVPHIHNKSLHINNSLNAFVMNNHVAYPCVSIIIKVSYYIQNQGNVSAAIRFGLNVKYLCT